MNEQANQNATHGSLPKRNILNEPVAAASVNLNTAKDNTTGRIPGDDPGTVPDGEALPSNRKNITPGGLLRKVSRQLSRDSQRSGNIFLSQSVLYNFLNMYSLQYSNF